MMQQQQIYEIYHYLWQYSWILGVFLVVLATAVANFLETRLYKRVLPKLQKTRHLWDDTLLKAQHRPINLLFWVYGLSASLFIIATKVKAPLISNAIPLVRNLCTIAVLLWFVIRFLSEFEEAFVDERRRGKKVDRTTTTAIFQLLRIAVVVTVCLIVLQTLNIDITGFVALGSVSTLVLGLAAKDWLGNFFGGFMIFVDRPFAIGDWIRSPDRTIEGTVEHIGWRLTRIRTFDKRPLYIPNGIFSNISIENPSRMSNRRIYATIGLRYDDATKVAVILSDVEAMLREHPEIDANQTLIVNLVEFGPSSLNFMVYTFTKTTEWVKFQAVQQDVFLRIIEIITQHGAQCAFPTTTLHVPDGVHVTQNQPDLQEV